MSKIPPKFRNYVAKPIRPVAEYASVAWSPLPPKDISAIDHESIQRRAAHFVNDYSRKSSVSVMLADPVNWQSREKRRIINDLTMFYKTNSNFFSQPKLALSRFSGD